MAASKPWITAMAAVSLLILSLSSTGAVQVFDVRAGGNSSIDRGLMSSWKLAEEAPDSDGQSDGVGLTGVAKPVLIDQLYFPRDQCKADTWSPVDIGDKTPCKDEAVGDGDNMVDNVGTEVRCCCINLYTILRIIFVIFWGFRLTNTVNQLIVCAMSTRN